MKKINIIKTNREYNEIIKTGRKINNKYVILFLKKEDSENYYFGFSVSKKLGNAVVRNKNKRQLKNILDKKSYKNGFKCIIMLKRDFINLEFFQKEKILLEIISSIGIVKGEK